jgi:pSer/pThr/pTyr-binding forkhead associated (FHA) protein
MKILTIGRKGAQILLEDTNSQISRLHAELTVSDKNTYYLVDCGSSNGTFVKRDGTWKPLRQEFVTENDEVRFGSSYVIAVRDLLKKSA